MNRTLSVIYASTSGHTEYVVDTLIATLQQSDSTLRVIKQRAETAKIEDIAKADILLLASSTWNTGNIEGQLNPHMYDLLLNRVATVNLNAKPCAAIGLGDERYFYTAKAADHLAEFIKSHNGQLLLPPLKFVNEPYGQEEKVKVWAQELAKKIDALPIKPL